MPHISTVRSPQIALTSPSYKCRVSSNVYGVFLWFFYTECFKKNFRVMFQMLLCGECYENVHTYRRTNYSSFMILMVRIGTDSLYAFKCKRFRNTYYTVTFGIPL
jgi:hypothetical protein